MSNENIIRDIEDFRGTPAEILWDAVSGRCYSDPSDMGWDDLDAMAEADGGWDVVYGRVAEAIEGNTVPVRLLTDEELELAMAQARAEYSRRAYGQWDEGTAGWD